MGKDVLIFASILFSGVNMGLASDDICSDAGLLAKARKDQAAHEFLALANASENNPARKVIKARTADDVMPSTVINYDYETNKMTTKSLEIIQTYAEYSEALVINDDQRSYLISVKTELPPRPVHGDDYIGSYDREEGIVFRCQLESEACKFKTKKFSCELL